ncbi:major facilitator superfamily domain-containing protein 1-like [Centruroides sculpturatus]|uniref:major facilitator superfamily domain-containing protein 1-like n=1 Tax=Centruroides sculpturatus TaxID=218467 RepID=UPI000C6D8980|nr:major facilitator superfamily domain-containing protein 1-like [Centruroides sculpturatus]
MSYSIGGESLAVAQNTYAVRWFKEKELNMVFGLQLSFARVGSSVNFWVMSHIYKWINNYFTGYTCLGIVLFIASSTCLLSLLCALILGYFDWRAEKILENLSNDTGEVIRIKDVKDFPLTFWLLSIICIAYYVAIFPFIALATVFFSRKYMFTQEAANSLDSIVYIISAAASPVLGFIVDKLGYNLSWVLASVIITLSSHMLLAFTFLNPWVAMVIMGVGYSLLACALWPMVAIEIPEHQLGTAYGIMQSIQNLGLAVASLCAGYIVDQKGYLFLEVFFLDCICKFVFADGRLNLSVAERTLREEEQLNAEAIDRERLLASGLMSDVTPHDLLWTHSDFSIRNRFLSRIGAKLPSHYDIGLRALIHRTGLK